ncbi:hypothetical protein NJ7G_1151 [Natrinema sp. J7-2]|uniref:Uncharacterized protein n=1 Tax=Natrinema gari JCM 14663 TaxID=1230459 RepID=L9ZA71_9EURY|nr:hypothetical protein NJ7G_1151 [Natrinema sp. J7-2]ELY83309.1 hypothetical protein C486_03063 [Natrinema gari JCM 14663]
MVLNTDSNSHGVEIIDLLYVFGSDCPHRQRPDAAFHRLSGRATVADGLDGGIRACEIHLMRAHKAVL